MVMVMREPNSEKISDNRVDGGRLFEVPIYDRSIITARDVSEPGQ